MRLRKGDKKKSKENKSPKNKVQFIIRGKNSTISLEATKQRLHFISLLIKIMVIIPRLFGVRLRRHTQAIPQVSCHLASIEAFISPVPQ